MSTHLHVARTEAGPRTPGPLRPIPAAVAEVIAAMNARYHEPIKCADLAAEVFISPFHFSRMFAKATGVTPGRYLAAIRMFEAKRLLLTTSLTISDIVCAVGYTSVGTFTTRFTRAVGMSPSRYREADVGEVLVAVSPAFQRLPSLDMAAAAPARTHGTGAVTVHVGGAAGLSSGPVFVAAFADRLPQSAPVAWSLRPGTGTEAVTLDVPPGRWYLMVVRGNPGELAIGDLRTAVTVRAGAHVTMRVPVRPVGPTDTPVAVTLAPSATGVDTAVDISAAHLVEAMAA